MVQGKTLPPEISAVNLRHNHPDDETKLTQYVANASFSPLAKWLAQNSMGKPFFVGALRVFTTKRYSPGLSILATKTES